jgi:hypothetical protein
MIRPTSSSRAHNPAADAGLLLIRLGLMILAFCAPMSTFFSRRLIFTLVPIGALLIILGALLRAEEGGLMRIIEQLPTPPLLIASALLGWIALSLFWTPMARAASEHWLKMCSTAGLAACACACLPSHSKVSNLNILPISTAMAALIILTLGLLHPLDGSDGGDSALQRTAIILSMTGWPAMAAFAVRSRWAAVGGLAVAIVFAIIAVWSQELLISTTISAAVFAISLYRPSITGQILGWLFAACLVLAPAGAIFFLIAPFDINPSGFFGSFIFWSTIIQIDGPRLITGHGFDAVMHGITNGLPLDRAPHSLVFEIWYELGIVGAMLGAVLIRAAYAAADRFTHPGAEPFVVACLTQIIIYLFCGITFAQLWFMTVLALTLIFLAVLAKGQYQIVRPRLP